MLKYDYLVVGGGAFGVSVTVALNRAFPQCRLCLVRGTDTRTASKDMNKIVRTAYPDRDYVQWAEDALNRWTDDRQYSKHFHSVSWVQVRGHDPHANMHASDGDQRISIDDLTNLVGARPSLSSNSELWLNKAVGYVDSAKSLEANIQLLLDCGVDVFNEDALELKIDIEGVCEGAKLQHRDVLAEETVLATGAWTPKILKDSKVRLFPASGPQAQFGSHFLRVIAVSVAVLKLTSDEFELMRDMPIIVLDKGEIIPSQAHRALKITTTETFDINHPGDLEALVNRGLNVDSNRQILETTFPQFAGRELISQVYSDLITPNQHPLIDSAPFNKNLHLAVGGSLHGFKFFTIIGELVTKHLRKDLPRTNLETKMLQRMSLQRNSDDIAVHPSIMPRKSTKQAVHIMSHI